jgi:hypothetical protein
MKVMKPRILSALKLILIGQALINILFISALELKQKSQDHHYHFEQEISQSLNPPLDQNFSRKKTSSPEPILHTGDSTKICSISAIGHYFSTIDICHLEIPYFTQPIRGPPVV